MAYWVKQYHEAGNQAHESRRGFAPSLNQASTSATLDAPIGWPKYRLYIRIFAYFQLTWEHGYRLDKLIGVGVIHALEVISLVPDQYLRISIKPLGSPI